MAARRSRSATTRSISLGGPFRSRPESKKLTLKDTLRSDLAHVLAKHLAVRLAKISDAGGDNWEFFDTLSEDPTILDFLHASERLAAAITAVYGAGAR